MRLLQLMFAGLLAAFAVLVAIGVFFGRLLRGPADRVRPIQPRQRPDDWKTAGGEVIEVETTVISTSQGER